MELKKFKTTLREFLNEQQIWKNSNTKFFNDDIGRIFFYGKDNVKYQLIDNNLPNRSIKIEIRLADSRNINPVAMSEFDKNDDGTYSQAMTGKLIVSKKGVGLAKAIYDYFDNVYGKITPSKNLTDDGEVFWNKNMMKDSKQSIKTTLREFLNESKKLDLDITNFLDSKNIVIDEYITSGTKGHIYSLTNGNVLKISDYRVDRHYIDYKEMEGKSNNFLVDIYNVYKYSNKLFVEMEKLNKIQFNRYSKFDKINSVEEILQSQFLSFLNYENNKVDLENAIDDFIKTNHHKKEDLDRLITDLDLDSDDVENILLDLDIMFDGQIELSNNYGLYLKDFHSNNIMESNKTMDYKLIDFI